MNDNLLTISEASKYLRVSKDTLRRWEKQKILKPYRSPTRRRYYDKKQLDYVFVKKPETYKLNDNVSQQTPYANEIKKPNPSISFPSITVKNNQSIRKVLLFIFIFLLFFNLTLIGFYLYQSFVY